MKRIFVIILGLFLALAATANQLDQEFANPPDRTKPRCYWYWMDGQITKEGITRDLEAMKRVGIGEGYIGIISGQSGTPASGGAQALSDEWWGFIEHAIREGIRLGVDIGFFNSPGWSQSGGPWVKPTQAMRYVTLPETRLRGPQHFEGKLPAPAGDFQDIAVLAFPAPAGEGEIAKLTARTPTAVTFEMPAPFTARSVTVQPVKPVNVTAELLASDDGQHYRPAKKFLIDRHNLGVNVGPVPLAPVVAAFPATTAQFFQLKFSGACELGDIRLSPAARVESFAEKSLLKMFQDPLPPFDFYTWPAQAEPEVANLMIKPEAVRNISKLMAADGTLRWDVPAGDWIVLRTAMTPTGTKNAPAPPEATGLEVDKMNRAALKSHFDAFIGDLLRRLPAAERKSFKHVVADSYEMGPENWTDDFAADFQKRYGYDPLRFLPVMTGRVVGSADQSNRFLWDLRRLVADRVARDYVGGLRDLCRPHGLKMWLENYGHWGFPSEFLLYGGYCDEISGEFWATGTLGSIELRDAASAAHIYGMPVVWAEAFTGGAAFVNAPRDLKARGDWAFCEGINQFVLHVYIHQPWDDRRPGVNAWFGTEFNRHNTWFNDAKPWVDYLRRCSVLLQSGKPVADVAYFIGEDAPKMAGTRQPELPAGHDFDYINADVIENRLTVQNGRFVLPDGISYRLLVLSESTTMRPALLKKLKEFVAAGGAVLGPAPERSPSLENFPACDAEVKKLADELWGRGRVMTGIDLIEAFRRLQVSADVACPGGILWKHCRDGDTDIYFLSNQKAQDHNATISFRVDDRAPEFWWPDSGLTEKAAVYDIGDGTVRVPVHLGPHGSVFVVFRKKAEPDRIVAVRRNGQLLLDTRAPAAIATAPAVDGTFTMAVWANPADNTPLFPETNRGISGLGDERNDLLFPAHGDTFAPGGTHAGAGLAVGRNGVCVFEHGARYFVPILVYPATLTNWTHIAVVYRNGHPRLYLNGQFVHEGLKSEHIVHPTTPGNPGPGGPFRGKLGDIDVSARAMTDAEIAQLPKSAARPGSPTGPAITVTRNARGKVEAQVWQSGTYEMKSANGKTQKIEVDSLPAPVEITGPWEVSFDPKWGGPAKVTFDKLVDWTQRPEPGIKYYSGKATYRKVFDLGTQALRHSGTHVFLDLGGVTGLAVFRVNGQELGTLWLAPWRVDITAVAKSGQNTLEIEVINPWNNRLVGDANSASAKPFTFLTAKTVNKHTPLQPAGLLGPVQLLTVEVR